MLTASQWHLGWTDARDFFRARCDGIALPHGDGDTVKSDRLGGHDGAADSKPVEEVMAGLSIGRSRDGADKIGVLDLWVLKRMREEKCADIKTCKFGWEWEQGFRKGVGDFYAAVGI